MKPLVKSNFSTALISPRLPSWIRSKNCIPRPTYRLAMDTTSRRLASARRCLARSPFLIICSSSRRTSGGISSPVRSSSASCSAASMPAPMDLASSTSSSEVSRFTLPISFRYIRTGSSVPKESTRELGSTISSSGISSKASMGGGASSGRSGM